MNEPKIGDRVHVRCICGDQHCPSPASSGGVSGELVNKEGTLYSVHLDKKVDGKYVYDFTRTAVRIES